MPVRRRGTPGSGSRCFPFGGAPIGLVEPPVEHERFAAVTGRTKLVPTCTTEVVSRLGRVRTVREVATRAGEVSVLPLGYELARRSVERKPGERRPPRAAG